MRYVFTEVLNDLIDYFLIADMRALLRFKEENGLPDNLAREFLTSESGDQVVHDGVVLPIPGVANFPYTIIFTIAPTVPRFMGPACRLQHRCNGYYLHVENRSLALFTWRILENFTEQAVDKLLEKYSEPNRPIIEIENGWYQVEVFAGWAEMENPDGPPFDDAVFEFVFSPSTPPQQPSQIDLGYPFTVTL